MAVDTEAARERTATEGERDAARVGQSAATAERAAWAAEGDAAMAERAASAAERDSATAEGVASVAERDSVVRGGHGELLGFRRAAEQLLLKPGELELGTCLGVIRSVADPAGRRRVPRAEVDRLRAAEGFPDVLRDRVRAVGTAEGAVLMGVGAGRFTRLARVGCFSPVAFRVNRYRAVVWRYPAAELRRFAEREPQLLTGCTPKGLRAMLDAGEDWRPRNWRSRRIGQLVRETEDAWRRAAVSAAVLGADQLVDVVDDPYERAHLRRLQPSLLPLRPGGSASWPVVERLLFADDPDEILWHRISLLLCLDEARAVQPAPRPGRREPGSELAVRGPEPEPGASWPGRQRAVSGRGRERVVPGPGRERVVSGAGRPGSEPWRTGPGRQTPVPVGTPRRPERARPAPAPRSGRRGSRVTRGGAGLDAQRRDSNPRRREPDLWRPDPGPRRPGPDSDSRRRGSNPQRRNPGPGRPDPHPRSPDADLWRPEPNPQHPAPHPRSPRSDRRAVV
ncbi:DUF6397 family protein [Streptomyces lycii]|uniref:Uncharacterized protein n=1 Tax=Streptomyces lycii TaxID=2654337 RepID=A0ABQ7FLQ8_9ACTN|nr:DUF6397 family protein [Streptomyces lycii]KAF4409887.1 hypothetical protein GCU69_06705 [Streptomyces lycii]